MVLMSDDPFETIEVGDLTAKLYTDDSPTSPREMGDDQELCPMICFSRYTLGDKHSYGDPDAFMMSLAEEHHDDLGHKLDTRLFNQMVPLAYSARPDQAKQVEAQIRAFDEKRREIIKAILDRHYIMLPLGLYDHSGITMYIGGRHPMDGAGWDSGQVGWIYCTHAQAKDEWGQQHYKGDGPLDYVRRAEEYLTIRVKEYDEYLRGDVYGYIVEDEDGEELESCWGLYGLEYAREEATAAAKAEWEGIQKKRGEEAAVELHAEAWYPRMMAL